MSQRIYTDELEGQHDFFTTYLPRVDKALDISNIQNDYSDGVVNGNIKTLANMVKEYYNHEIVPVLFQYEFLK